MSPLTFFPCFSLCSYDRGSTFNVFVGKGQLIAGMDKALVGMCVNERRFVKIPPKLAYGSEGVCKYSVLKDELGLQRTPRLLAPLATDSCLFVSIFLSNASCALPLPVCTRSCQ